MGSGKFDFKGADAGDIAQWITSLGEKPYRVKQLRQWVFTRGVADFSQMTDISKSFRATLEQTSTVTALKVLAETRSSDGTMKFLFGLKDGHSVETVWIPDEDRATLCVSSQVGCKLKCGFCLTGHGGFQRNLSTAEIVDQLIQARLRVPGGRVTNIVLMGMGEPLDNYGNVLKAIRIITDEELALVGARKITLSTAGVVPGILKLAEDFPKIKLAVSLNAPTDEKREKIMPINKKYPINELMKALSKWPLPRGRRITFEYVMLGGFNDSDEDAKKLVAIARRIPSKINLIPFNPCPELGYQRPSDERIERFYHTLIDSHLTVFIRQSRGQDILAACGQLRESLEMTGPTGGPAE
ncbi:MAG: 23S rRNA (adenine(2503)-C(2))-methyltransferase RlmN [Nitrospinae bacterium]|nr:23S rRNA (adenine(2503)-C(2))-methyltransferase RlmN [Nitrospinota bacterium]